MGCSFRFAGNPGRTKERRIERIAGQHAPRAAKAKEKPAGLGRRLHIDLYQCRQLRRPLAGQVGKDDGRCRVVGQFDCGRMTGLNGNAGGAYLENELRFVCAIDPRRIRLAAGLR